MQVSNNGYINATVYQSVSNTNTVVENDKSVENDNVTKTNEVSVAVKVSIGEEKYSYDDLVQNLDKFSISLINSFSSDETIGAMDRVFMELANNYKCAKENFERYASSENDLDKLMKSLDNVFNSTVKELSDNLFLPFRFANTVDVTNRIQAEQYLNAKDKKHVSFSAEIKMTPEEIKKYDSFKKLFTDSIKQIAETTKNYVLEGNKIPRTAEEKSKLSEYLAKNSIEGFLSSEDIKASMKEAKKAKYLPINAFSNSSNEEISAWLENKDNFFLDSAMKKLAELHSIDEEGLSVEEIINKFIEKQNKKTNESLGNNISLNNTEDGVNYEKKQNS